MKPSAALRWGLLLLVAAFAACGRDAQRSFLPNQPPEIQLQRPIKISTGETTEMAFAWSARDPDGRVSHYLYATDPANVDRPDPSWARTSQDVVRTSFARRVTIGRAAAAPTSGSRDFRVFAVCAVDDQGAVSAPATVAMFGDSIAPRVVITSPSPNLFFTPILPATFEIHWQGEDQDGQIAEYKYRLFTTSNPDFPQIPDFISFALSNPDTLRALYAPSFESWETVGANVTSVTYTDLAPDQLYLFAITAFDREGHYDPVFSAGRNLLKFAVSEELSKPQLCVASRFFNYCAPMGGDLSLTFEAPAGNPIPVTWVASPPAGIALDGYRWAIDPRDTTGRVDREHENADANHWSAWSPTATSATIPGDGAEHTLYVEARTEVGSVSRLRLRIVQVVVAHERNLLVVDDTRLTPDQRNPTGGYDPPRGAWPTAAELDTFLYARGGVPWQYYPAGTLSSPGLLSGYDFDTLGTRGIPDGVVPLTTLSRYRQVIWLTDGVGATYTGSPQDLLAPVTSLRLMSSPGQLSTLAAYVAAGGKLWLAGGGAAYATLVAWNRRNTPPDTWSNSTGELVEGRFMYDFPHWRSEIKVSNGAQGIFGPTLADPTASPGRGWPGQPNYAKLAAAAPYLLPRTCATDPPPPLRLCNSFYIVNSFPAEYLTQPNVIAEDVDPRPNHESLQSTLDTLYTVVGSTTTPGSPLMTYYHGSEGGSVVFSGFPIWHFQRAQCQALTDFVLQDIWGLSRQSGAASTAAVSRSRPTRAAATAALRR